MKESPVLFSASMVRAILDGRKTQTRRVIVPQFHAIDNYYGDVEESDKYPGEWLQWKNGEPQTLIECRYGTEGDRLWVKEGLRWHENWVCYDADKTPVTVPDDVVLKVTREHITSMFMPRWASRLTLEITEVRVHRLHEISGADAIAEGTRIHENPLCEVGCGRFMYSYQEGEHSNWELDPITAYRKLWNDINAKKHPWETNPWVWAITFRRVL